VETKFSPTQYYIEYPIHYTTDKGQVMNGWIDLLLESEAGFVLIDHKASPRARADWNEIALSYSRQLQAYANGITKTTGKPVLSCWIHFAVTGGMVEVVAE
jgi:ATP-dependent exoDNAse (exonuclease V) beta subunit